MAELIEHSVAFKSLSEVMSHERKNAELIISNSKETRPDLNNFVDIYTPETIEHDKAEVEKIKKEFTESSQNLTGMAKEKKEAHKKRSDALEIIIGEQIEKSGWFGDSCRLSRSTEYDDLKNGVDSIAEFVDENDQTHRLALAIDASMRADIKSVRYKINRNILKMKTNTLEVKYFQSRIDGFKGKLDNIVPVVIGIEGENTNEIVANFSKMIKFAKIKDTDPVAQDEYQKLSDKLKNHPAQVIFLREIQDQLYIYYLTLKNLQQGKTTIKTDQIYEMLYVVKTILDGKEGIKTGDLEKDNMYQLINSLCEEKKSLSH